MRSVTQYNDGDLSFQSASRYPRTQLRNRTPKHHEVIARNSSERHRGSNRGQHQTNLECKAGEHVPKVQAAEPISTETKGTDDLIKDETKDKYVSTSSLRASSFSFQPIQIKHFLLCKRKRSDNKDAEWEGAV